MYRDLVNIAKFDVILFKKKLTNMTNDVILLIIILPNTKEYYFQVCTLRKLVNSSLYDILSILDLDVTTYVQYEIM